MTIETKTRLKRELARCLRDDPEIRRVVVFGSFLSTASPNDLDVAVFHDGSEAYLPLALRYRRLVRPVADQIPIDILPVREDASGALLDEINRGEVVYER